MPGRTPPKIRVVLHERAHLRFVPRVPPGGELLGVVERGMHIGALARLQDGSFVQVNGDVIQPLNRSQVETALRRTAPSRTGGSPSVVRAAPVNVAKVHVTIKQRRRLPARAGSGESADDGR